MDINKLEKDYDKILKESSEQVLNEQLITTVLAALAIWSIFFTTSVYQNIRAMVSKCYRQCSGTSVIRTLIKMGISPIIPIINIGGIKAKTLCIKICRYKILAKNLNNTKDDISREALNKKLEEMKKDIIEDMRTK